MGKALESQQVSEQSGHNGPFSPTPPPASSYFSHTQPTPPPPSIPTGFQLPGFPPPLLISDPTPTPSP